MRDPNNCRKFIYKAKPRSLAFLKWNQRPNIKLKLIISWRHNVKLSFGFYLYIYMSKVVNCGRQLGDNLLDHPPIPDSLLITDSLYKKVFHPVNSSKCQNFYSVHCTVLPDVEWKRSFPIELM
jgi:hypothetical protein